MKRHRFMAFTTMTAAVLSCHFADGADLVNKPLSTFDTGWNSNINGIDQQIADEFSLETSAIADELAWCGLHQLAAPTGIFRIRMFNDHAGAPSATPFYDHVIGVVAGSDTGLNNQNGNRINLYESAIPPVALNAATKYWLTVADTTDPIWVWSYGVAGPSTGDDFVRYGDQNGWASIAGLSYPPEMLDQAFRLSGSTVPEPSTISLLVIAYMACITPSHRNSASQDRV